ncbi:unnamed protein product [marine sediment metagenome]|uniref:Uncharacterized protein n=1 Tax=marine sediment metagenome TaxID=412755 RepID=X1NGW8_9ZZZZ
MDSWNSEQAAMVQRAICALQEGDSFTALMICQQLEKSGPVASSAVTVTVSPGELANAADQNYLRQQAEQNLRNGRFAAAKLYLKSMRIKDRSNYRD